MIYAVCSHWMVYDYFIRSVFHCLQSGVTAAVWRHKKSAVLSTALLAFPSGNFHLLLSLNSLLCHFIALFITYFTWISSHHFLIIFLRRTSNPFAKGSHYRPQVLWSAPIDKTSTDVIVLAQMAKAGIEIPLKRVSALNPSDISNECKYIKLSLSNRDLRVKMIIHCLNYADV